jgi:hypothetical protein
MHSDNILGGHHPIAFPYALVAATVDRYGFDEGFGDSDGYNILILYLGELNCWYDVRIGALGNLVDPLIHCLISNGHPCYFSLIRDADEYHTAFCGSKCPNGYYGTLVKVLFEL